MRKRELLMSAVFALSFAVNAQDEKILIETPKAEIDHEMAITKKMVAFKRGEGKGIIKAVKKKGGWIGESMAQVSVGPENPQWGKFRVMAYEKALSDVENKYLQNLGKSIKAEKVTSFFKNINDEVPDFKPEDLENRGKLSGIFDKLIAVTEAKLDIMLEELGVDKKQFKSAPKSQKHKMLSQSLSKITTVESFGKLAGLIPIKTFEGSNEKGEHSIGVICVSTPNLRQFAYDITHARGALEPSPKKGEDLYDKFTAEDAGLINEFGIRKMKDENGYPVLVSFGQWANSKRSTNSRVRNMYRKAAMKQASMNADNQIAMYIAGSSIFTSNAEIGESYDQIYKVTEDNYKEDISQTTLKDSLEEKSKSKANINISGLTELHSETVKHPYGHEIAIVIKIWSPITEQSARRISEWKPDTAPANSRKKKIEKKAIKTRAEVKSSQNYMDVDDF